MGDNFDAKKSFDLYIHDYMLRKKMPQVADMFAKEANFIPEQMESDSEEGFLREWWYIFQDHFSAWEQGVTHPQTGGPSKMQGPGKAPRKAAAGQPSPLLAPPPSLNTSNEDFNVETIFQEPPSMVSDVANPQNSVVDVMQKPDSTNPTYMPMTMPVNFSSHITRDKQRIRMMPTPNLPSAGTTVVSQAMPNTGLVNQHIMPASLTNTNTEYTYMYPQTNSQPYVPSIAELEEVYGPMSALLKASLGQDMARRVVRAQAQEVRLTYLRNAQGQARNLITNPDLSQNMASSSSRESSRMQSTSRTNALVPFSSPALQPPSSRSPK